MSPKVDIIVSMMVIDVPIGVGEIWNDSFMVPVAPGLGWCELRCPQVQTWTAAVTATKGSQAWLAVHGWLVAIAGPDWGLNWRSRGCGL